MKNRIKMLRNDVGLTQQQFAANIGVSQNTFANYEIGRRNPSNSTINNICKTFNVDENWLRTGEGDMYVSTPDEPDKIDLNQFVKEHGGTDIDIEVMKAYFDLPPEVRRSILQRFKKALDKMDAEAAASGSVPPEPKGYNEMSREELHVAVDRAFDLEKSTTPAQAEG